MKRNLIGGAIFAVAALLPALLVHFMYRYAELGNPSAIFLYLFCPAICAFISAYLLGGKITFDDTKKYYGLGYCLLISIAIVVLSLILWIIPAYITFEPYEKSYAPTIALIAGTFFGWVTYPPGILAGLIVWRLTKTQPGRKTGSEHNCF